MPHCGKATFKPILRLRLKACQSMQRSGGPLLRRKYRSSCGAANGDWRGAILLGYYTGARLSDVANMRWDAIDWRNKVIRFTPSKTKKPVTIPLHRDLERELLKNAGIGKAPMFPSLAGKDTGGKHGLSGRFAAIMEKARIEGKPIKPVVGERYQALAFTACDTRLTAQWQTPVYHRKSGRNSPATHRRKRTKFTRITNLKRCVRQSQSFRQWGVLKVFSLSACERVGITGAS